MEEMFHFDDDDDDYSFENSIDPSFFNMTNPTLADLSMDNNRNNVGPTPSQQNHHFNFSTNINNNGSHINFHELGILQRSQTQSNSNFNGQFSTLLSQQNHHDIQMSQQNQHGIFHNTNSDTFNSNSNAMLSQQNHHQQGQGGNNDPFHYNLISPEDHHQQVQGDNNNNNNNDSLFTNEMSQQNHHGGNNQSFSDPMVQEQYVQNNNNNFSLGGNNFEVGGTSQMHEDQQLIQPSIQTPDLPNQNEVLAIDQWPPTQVPFFCTCCQVLREIIHANGFQFEKLEIHGRIGLITHAIHHKLPTNGNTPNYQMIDFCKSSLDEIKKYLAKYCVDRNTSGYFILQDPMSAFYETLCTGLDWIDDINMEGPMDNNQNNSDDMGENATSDKKDLSAQRKKSASLTLSDLRDYFHLPIEEASDHPNVKLCPTVLKKTCRKAGLQRWPHRKVKSLLKQIAIMGAQLDGQDSATRARTEHEINRLKQEMIAHCGGYIPTAMHNIAAFLPQQQQ
ncbi:putative uncharacterized protein DDB_G0277255 [Trifolium pratense]|nr:putative uncharacterized protein DDB_G0277255 [Trifolium pratense]